MTQTKTTIYGIKNCDTMKKARTWLKDNEIPNVFHNYKKDGVDVAILKQALDQHGWETVINQRGRTWHQLPGDIKSAMNAENALEIALENPSIIKRPLLVHGETVTLGFKSETYTQIFQET